MPFLEIMHTYFRGERLEALLFILPVGVALIGLGAVIIKVEKGGFAWGLAVPLLLFGLVTIATGLGVGLRTPGQVAALEQAYEVDPAAMIVDEMPRMEKVNANWPVYVGGYAFFVIIGLGLRFGLKADWAHGLGPALILIGALGFLIDGVAERRARPYTAALQEIVAQTGAQSR